MKKTFTKYLTIIFLALYSILNFATFADASICIATDHVGLNFFGVDSCCIERQEKPHNVKVANITSVQKENCIDQTVSTISNEQVPEINGYLIDIQTIATIVFTDFNYINFQKVLYGQKSSRAPDNLALNPTKTTKLTI